MKLRFPASAVLLVSLLLASCSAPISFETVAIKTPVGNYEEFPLSRALRELEAGKSEPGPLDAGGHFFECARLAAKLAVAGEPGALALYNQATGLLVGSLGESQALPWPHEITLGGGAILRGKREPGAPPVARRYLNVDSLEFDGVLARICAARPGVGAPLVAIEPKDENHRSHYGPPELHKALTAVLRFDSSKSATLELHDPLDTESISIAGHKPRLAADFSAPVSIQLSIYRPDKLGLVRLINPQKYSDTARLTRLQDYDARRTPVLLVHGLDSTPATWALMYHRLMQFDNRPEIDTAIFMATPHRGSELSTHFVGRLVSRFIRLPAFLTDTRNAIASILTADAASLQLDRAPNSIDTLSPRNRFVREVNNLPIAPEVTCHSIIGDRGKDDTPDSSDGVVAYWSSHLRGAASEKIVPSGHAPHRHPEGIEEVSRILKERLK